jgi:hypothetical protein
MCTLSFIARSSGYLLGMNRDEKRSRAIAEPPKARQIRGRKVLCPMEGSGGTWIAVNEHGSSFALLNWYAVPLRVAGTPLSRGEVVVRSVSCASSAALEKLLLELPLERVNPFRLVSIFAHEQSVVEWRWDLTKLKGVDHDWQNQIWISSGLDEPGAQEMRAKVFGFALHQSPIKSSAWLRRLHSGHAPRPGPYSICMHRADAETVSYTELMVSKQEARMRYISGAPCSVLAASFCSFKLK